MIELIPRPAVTPPKKESKTSSKVIGTNVNFIAIRKAITLIIILKKAAEKEEDKWRYFLVSKLVKAMQKAPINTNKIPR